MAERHPGDDRPPAPEGGERRDTTGSIVTGPASGQEPPSPAGTGPPPFTVVIPARFHSTRLPGKVLLEIGGEPMLAHVYRAARGSGAREVIVATDHPSVLDVARALGARSCLTASTHQTGTDRLAEVVEQVAMEPEHIVVNVQADEPFLPSALIDQVAAELARHPEAAMATLSRPVAETRDLFDPNVVKVVVDRSGAALYFSRAPIPWVRDRFRAPGETGGEDGRLGTGSGPQGAPQAGLHRHHMGIYAYRAGFVRRFVSWPRTPLEMAESLEQLRALEHGARIVVADACKMPGPGIDTPEDLELARRHWALRVRPGGR